MPSLRVDTDALRRNQTTLAEIGRTLESATADLDDVSGASVAQSDLRARIEDLGGSWGIGLKKLGGFAGEAAQALAGVADAFEHTDTELARGIAKQPGPGSPGSERAV